MLPKRKVTDYNGLTIIMSNPSRFDKFRLLCPPGGSMFNDFCLRPETNVMRCDVREMEDESPFVEGTKCIMLLGESAMKKYCPWTKNNSLGEMRGSVHMIGNIPAIPSYLPQDANDYERHLTNHEPKLNPLCKDYVSDADMNPVVETEDGEDEGDVKSHGKTKGSNYTFWLKRDTWKAKQIILGKYDPTKRFTPDYIINPPVEVIVNALLTNKGKVMDFDIETDREEWNLQCFAFSFDDSTVYACPILNYNYKPVPGFHLILHALAVAFRDNIVSAHNGANFDFLVMAWKYKIGIRNAYDTLIAMHRCFPDIEKSLAHCASYWTWEPFHKDQDSWGYRTHTHMMDRLKYCAKDVYVLRRIRQEIQKYSSTIPGLEKSINDAMRCIKPYLITTLQGIRMNKESIDETVQENDRLMTHYNRMIEHLIGERSLAIIRGGNKKAAMFASSNPQCAKYFHDQLGYPVTKRTDTGAPALGKKSLFTLQLKHDNPIIRLICAFRATGKETSRLRSLPWIDTQSQIVRPCGNEGNNLSGLPSVQSDGTPDSGSSGVCEGQDEEG